MEDSPPPLSLLKKSLLSFKLPYNLLALKRCYQIEIKDLDLIPNEKTVILSESEPFLIFGINHFFFRKTDRKGTHYQISESQVDNGKEREYFGMQHFGLVLFENEVYFVNFTSINRTSIILSKENQIQKGQTFELLDKFLFTFTSIDKKMEQYQFSVDIDEYSYEDASKKLICVLTFTYNIEKQTINTISCFSKKLENDFFSCVELRYLNGGFFLKKKDQNCILAMEFNDNWTFPKSNWKTSFKNLLSDNEKKGYERLEKEKEYKFKIGKGKIFALRILNRDMTYLR